MNRFFDSLLDGFASIGRGMASIGRGMASIFGGGTDLRDDPEIRKIMERSDAEALASDWNAVINDWNDVISDRQLYNNLEDAKVLKKVREDKSGE